MIDVIYGTEYPIQLIGNVAGLCYGANTDDNAKNYKRGIDCIKSEHGRTFEYPDITLEISGYSARVIRELYTHVIGTSKLQESTRYVNCADYDYYIPDTIKTTEQINTYVDAMEKLKGTYRSLIRLGVPKEDVANILPLAMHTKIVFKANLRAILHLFELRTCNRAYKEFRELMKELREVLSNYSPEWETIMNDFAVTKCIKAGYCTEKECCGRAVKKGVSI